MILLLFQLKLSTDLCRSYYLLVLHPGYKLEYFKNAGWDETWVDTAKALVRKQFDLRYASRGSNDNENVSKDVVEKPTEVTQVSGIYYEVSARFNLCTSPSHRLGKTYSTTSRHLSRFAATLRSLMNSRCTSLLRWRMSKIPFGGGMRNRRHTLAFLVWPWTILVFPVC